MKCERLPGVCGLFKGMEKNTPHITSDRTRLWRPTRLSRQMRGRHARATPLITHNPKHVAEPLGRRNAGHYELPKINVAAPGPQGSVLGSTPPAFTLTRRGTLPAIISKKS